MNKEEILNKYIDLINKGYCSDCNELNCIDNFPHAKITQAIRELQQKNQELQQENEKNKHYKTLYQSLKKQKEELRSWLKEMLDNEDDIFSVVRVKDVLSKLEELEGVNDE